MIDHVAETGSTNADLILAAGAEAAEGTWLRADRQTAGRGRHGRSWSSPPGNLFASTIVRPRSGDPAAETLALVAGIAMVDVARVWASDAAPQLLLKWPNDVLAGGAKLAGILLERAGEAVVIGFGANLAHHPQDIDRAATSLVTLAGIAPDPALFLDDLADALARWLRIWREQGLEPIRRGWMAAAHPIGTALVVSGREGLFDGLDADGALRLRRADGAIEHIRAGEVFLL